MTLVSAAGAEISQSVSGWCEQLFSILSSFLCNYFWRPDVITEPFFLWACDVITEPYGHAADPFFLWTFIFFFSAIMVMSSSAEGEITIPPCAKDLRGIPIMLVLFGLCQIPAIVIMSLELDVEDCLPALREWVDRGALWGSIPFFLGIGIILVIYAIWFLLRWCWRRAKRSNEHNGLNDVPDLEAARVPLLQPQIAQRTRAPVAKAYRPPRPPSPQPQRRARSFPTGAQPRAPAARQSRTVPSATSERVELFHGTSYDAATSISEEGSFRFSQGGLFGSGVYFSQSIAKAEQFGPAVLRCKANRSACEFFKEKGGVVLVRHGGAAHLRIHEVVYPRMRCRLGGARCHFAECRECKPTRADRAAAFQTEEEIWDATKKRCPGLRDYGGQCFGKGWCKPTSTFCNDCRIKLYGNN
jgi:hypothetical protein